MAGNEYRLHYEHLEDVVFPSQKGMQRYLAQESEAWAAFLDYVHDNLTTPIETNRGRSSVNAERLAAAIDNQSARLDDAASFNRSTMGHANSEVVPPPSESLKGQLILGLFDSDAKAEALAAYVCFVADNTHATYNTNDAIHKLVNRGRVLLDAAPIVKALPYSRVSTAKIAGAARTAENHVQSLAEAINAAREENIQHSAKLVEYLSTQKQEASRVNNIILRLNRRRSNQLTKWQARIAEAVAVAFDNAERKARLVDVTGQQTEEKRVKEFERLQALFETQLRLRAPVKLWETREVKHSRDSKAAMRNFIIAGLIAIAFGLGVPFFAGDYIANSFSQQLCTIAATATAEAQGCERVFSAKGPVTITGLLLVMSLLMWMARLQYRVHLSERHLALDASEKKAFAETYLAMWGEKMRQSFSHHFSAPPKTALSETMNQEWTSLRQHC